MIALDRTNNEYGFDSIDEQALDRDANHYVEVVSFDGEKFTYRASPILVLPWTEQTGTTDPEVSEGSSLVDRLVSGDLNILLGSIIFAVAVLGVAFTFRSSKGANDELWDISTREVEIDAMFDREIQEGLKLDEAEREPVKSPDVVTPAPKPGGMTSSDDYLDDLAKDLEDFF